MSRDAPADGTAARAWQRAPRRSRAERRRIVDSWLGRPCRELEPFAAIVECLLETYGDVAALPGPIRRAVELGPGRRVALARALADRLGSRFECVGLPRFRTDLECYRFVDLAEWVASVPPRSLDLVVSRHALEENSFHPLALLASKGLRRLVITGRRDDVLESIPGTRPYLARFARNLASRLRPGAHVIAGVLDRPRAGAFLDGLVAEGLQIVRREHTGGRSGILHARRPE